MSSEDLLTEERRARMAAERLLAQKEAELHEANRMLSRHARALSEDLVETREEVVEVRSDLVRATTEVDIAKRRLWSSIETIADGFAVFDAESRLVIANNAYYAPFDGLECIRPGAHYEEVVEAVLAEGIVDIGDRSRPEWRDWMLERWRSDTLETREIRLWNGAYVRLVDRRAPDGDTVCMAMDITRSIRREKALRAARNRAEAASRAKSAFLANMSHEIRTPMNGVVGMADLMAEHELDEELRTYVDTIRSSGRALLTIINDVLDYSKIEASKLELHPEPFDLEQTIIDVIALLQPSIREKGLRILLDYDMFLPTRYEGDPVRIRQVLTNLIGNAVKFTSEGHVLIRVLGLPDPAHGGERIHITVEDTGIGIPPELQTAVFGEFNQVEDERNRRFEGTGLGLAITRQLIELMGGEVWVESEVGVGSCFGLSVTFPVVEEEALPRVPAWLHNALLLMADDMNRSILAKRLIALGLSVEMAEHAGAIDPEGYDVVFIDQKLCEAGVCAEVFTPKIVVADPLATDLPDDAPARILQKPLSRPQLMSRLADLPEPGATGIPGFRSRRNDPPQSMPEGASPQPAARGPVYPSHPMVSDQPSRARRPASTPPALPSPASDAPAIADAKSHMRVLVAEDNKTNRFVFSKLVKDCAIELTFAEDGARAVERFRETRPDLVFMDISMPGMDGKEATRAIRAFETDEGLARTRIVALTAHAMTGDDTEIMSHGLDAHLTKPFPKDLILAEIEAACPPGAHAPLPVSADQAAG